MGPPMTMLSETELRLCRGLNKRRWNLDLETILAARPLATIVGEGPGKNTRTDCPMFPFPKTSSGWRLWKLSGLELTEYLASFRRVNLTVSPEWNQEEAVANAKALRAEAESTGTPLILLGARVSGAFSHDHEAFTWASEHMGGVYPDSIRIPHPSGRSPAYNNKEAQGLATKVLREALARGRYPRFERRPDEALRCGLMLSAHPRAEFQSMAFVVTCPGDLGSGRHLVLPWGPT
jgi:hypothetical protein